MDIVKDFSGGNINILDINGDEIYVEREIRDDKGYFYWAFCVKNAGGKKLTFNFPSSERVGMFGAAVSYDLKNWFWSESKFTKEGKDGFTYHFSEDENSVYFAHNMIYTELRLKDFLENYDITPRVFCKSKKGRDVPFFSMGEGEKILLVTSRHHACESTGTYVLEGIAKGFLENPIKGIKFVFVPFVDYDGVTDGDAGKDRLPHDHNRDYKETPSIYHETEKLKELADGGNVLMNFDLHSPHHAGWINDYPYLMRCEDEEGKTDVALSRLLREYTEKDASSMKYSGNEDLPSGSKYNGKDTENMRNYFMKRTLSRLSYTLEMPYFGLPENKFGQEKTVNFGKNLYRAIVEIIKEKRLLNEKV